MKKLIICVISIFAGILASAQNLSTEINVDRTVQPVESTAMPLSSIDITTYNPENRLPEIQITEFTSDVSFAPFSTAPNPFLSPLLPARSPYKGYVTAGYFPAYNFNAQAGYRLVQTNDSHLDVSARFAGLSYSAPCPDDEMEDFTNSANTLDAAVGYSKNFKPGTLTINASYLHSWIKTAGRQAFVSKIESVKFGFDNADIRAAFNGAAKYVTYDADASFSHQSALGTKLSVSKLNASLLFRKGAERPGFELNLDFGNAYLSKPQCLDNSSISTLDESSSSMYAAITPALYLHKRKVFLHLGIRAMIGHNMPSGFYISPDIDFRWTVVKPVDFIFSYKASSGFNTLAEQFAYSPLAVTGFLSAGRLQPALARAGFNIYPLKGLTAELYATYGRVKNQMLPAGYVFDYDTQIISRALRIYGYAHYNSLGAEGAISYKIPPADIKARVSAAYYANGCPVAGIEAFDRAKFVMNASVQGRPIPQLLLGLNLQCRTNRLGAYAHNGALKPYTSLDFNGSYQISERLTAFLSIDNLLCRRNMLAHFLYSQRISGQAGVVYRY